jgi:hypothetical protein
LTQEQWIKQHDDLTKMLKKWEQGGKKRLPEGAEQYLGMNDLQVARAIKEAEAKATRLGKKGPNWKEKEVQAQKDEYYSKKDMEKEWEFENKLAKQEMQQEDQMIDKALSGMDERTLIKTKYPGISDDLLDKILVDANPQRKADVMATMDQYLKLREIGKSETEAYDIITKSFSKTPTKHASGGIAGQLHLNEGGRARFANGSRYKIGMWNPDKTLVSVGINPGTGTPEWMYPHEAAAMGIFPTMDYEGNKIASTNVPGTPIVPTGAKTGQNIIGNPHINMSNELWNRTQLDPNDPNWYDDYEHDYGLPLGSQAERDEALSNVMRSDEPDEAKAMALIDEFYKLDAERNKAREAMFRTNVPGTQASTPVAGDKSLLSKVVEGAKGVGQDLLTLGSIPANYAAGLTGLPIGYTTQAMRDRVEELAKSKGTGEFTVGYDDLGMKSTIDPTSFGGIIPESGIPPSITDLAIGLTAGDVSGKVSPEGKVTYDPETLAYDFGQKDPMAKTETGVSLLDVINRGGLTGRRVYTPMTSTFGSQTTQLPSSGVNRTEQIARASQYGDPRMQAAQAKGYDPRMGRTYTENIQAMADPRMLQAKGGRASYTKGGLAKILGV